MKRQIKDVIYGHLAHLTKALSSPKRLEIIELLSQGEKTVEQVAEQAGLGVKNASAQLKELRAARLVEARKDGKYVHYRLADSSVARFWVKLRTFGQEHIAELQEITKEAFDAPEILSQMSRKELLEKAKKGEVVMLDVRPADEYETAHLPFAVSVPANELPKHLKTLSKKKQIVAYCRGPYCFFAKESVESLRRHGYKAFTLSDSVHDWASHGLPIDQKRKGA